MRATSVVIALMAGTAVRFLLTALPPFRRRRRLRRQAQSAARRDHQYPAAPKRTRHPEILALLEKRAPTIRADHWHRDNNNVECTFCLETIRPSRTLLRVTPCSHVFHACCLEQWVLYTAEACLDWHQYSLSDDGSIKSSVRHPSCPNCSTDLNVMPAHLLKKVMLTSIARSLSLRDLSAAAEMYDAGLVYRASPAHSIHAAQRQPSAQPSAPPPRPVPRYVRQDSTVSEPPDISPITERDSSQRARRSLPEEMVALIRPPLMTRSRSVQRGWRRFITQIGLTEELSRAHFILQASS